MSYIKLQSQGTEPIFFFLLPTSPQIKRTSERSRLFAFVKYIRTFAAVMKKRNSTLYGQASLRAFIHPGPNASYRPKAMRGQSSNRSTPVRKQSKPLPLHRTSTSSAIHPQAARHPSRLKMQTLPTPPPSSKTVLP